MQRLHVKPRSKKARTWAKGCGSSSTGRCCSCRKLDRRWVCARSTVRLRGHSKPEWWQLVANSCYSHAGAPRKACSRRHQNACHTPPLTHSCSKHQQQQTPFPAGGRTSASNAATMGTASPKRQYSAQSTARAGSLSMKGTATATVAPRAALLPTGRCKKLASTSRMAKQRNLSGYRCTPVCRRNCQHDSN